MSRVLEVFDAQRDEAELAGDYILEVRMHPTILLFLGEEMSDVAGSWAPSWKDTLTPGQYKVFMLRNVPLTADYNLPEMSMSIERVSRI